MSIVNYSKIALKSQFHQRSGFILLELSIGIFIIIFFSVLIAQQYATMLVVQKNSQQYLQASLYAQSLIAQLRTGQQVANPQLYPNGTKIMYTVSQPIIEIPYYAIKLTISWQKPTVKNLTIYTGMLA